jgi:uncharacterized membrane protein
VNVRARLARLFGFDSPAVRLFGLAPRQWLWLLTALSIGVQLWLSLLYAAEFRTGADLGTFMQAFWSTGHGRPYWATTVYAYWGVTSILRVHFSWVLLGLTPVFLALPGSGILFAIQALVLGAAAAPLYGLVVAITKSELKGLAVAAIYLSWGPLYAGNPSSFHLESFLPLEFFAVLLFWWRAQYVRGLVTASLAAFTLDGVAVLTLLIGVYFLLGPVLAVIGHHGANDGRADEPLNRSVRKRLADIVWRIRESPVVLASLALIVLSVSAFFAMRLLEANFLNWVGFPGNSLPVTRIVGFGPENLGYELANKLEFWLILFGTVGFLPLLRPRLLVVVGPWVAYTLFESSPVWFSITNEHVDIIAFALFFGVAVALDGRKLIVPVPVNKQPRPGSQGTETTWPSSEPDAKRVEARHRIAYRITPLAGILAVVLLFNLILSPLDPIMSAGVANISQAPFLGPSYRVSVTPPEGAGYVGQLVSLIPDSATVLNAGQFYPLMYRHPLAYPMGKFNSSYFPFSTTNLPDFVLAPTTEAPALDRYVPGLTLEIWNRSLFGVRGWTESDPLGPVFLWQRNFSAAPQVFGPVSYPSYAYRFGSTLLPGPAGTLIPQPANGTGGYQIFSPPNATGVVWRAFFHAILPQGVYVLSIVAELAPILDCSSLNSSLPILFVGGQIPGAAPNYKTHFSAGRFRCGQWATLSATVQVSSPVPAWTFFALRPTSALPLTLAFALVAIAPA